MTIQIRDYLKINENSKLLESFTPTEIVIYSGELIKINKKKRKQKRNMVITTESIYSIREDSFFSSAIQLMGFGGVIRRRIDITKVEAIIYAR